MFPCLHYIQSLQCLHCSSIADWFKGRHRSMPIHYKWSHFWGSCCVAKYLHWQYSHPVQVMHEMFCSYRIERFLEKPTADQTSSRLASVVGKIVTFHIYHKIILRAFHIFLNIYLDVWAIVSETSIWHVQIIFIRTVLQLYLSKHKVICSKR